MKSQFLRQGIHPDTKSPLFISELASFEELENAELPAKPLKLRLPFESTILQSRYHLPKLSPESKNFSQTEKAKGALVSEDALHI